MALNQQNLDSIVKRLVNARSSTAATAWIVTTEVTGGRSRRRVYLTRQGARTAAERDLAAGRAEIVTRAKLLVAVPVSTGGL